MGNSIEKIKEAAQKSADEEVEKRKSQLEILHVMGQAKLDHFLSQVKLASETTNYKIGKTLIEHTELRMTTSIDTKRLKEGAQGVVDNIAKGQVAAMIKNVVGLAIDAVMAQASGRAYIQYNIHIVPFVLQQSGPQVRLNYEIYSLSSGSLNEKKTYTVRLDGFALQRVDIYLFTYDISAAGLVAEHETLVAYAYTISTLGEEVSPSTLRNLIAMNYSTQPGLDADDYMAHIRKQLEIYELVSYAMRHTEELKLSHLDSLKAEKWTKELGEQEYKHFLDPKHKHVKDEETVEDITKRFMKKEREEKQGEGEGEQDGGLMLDDDETDEVQPGAPDAAAAGTG